MNLEWRREDPRKVFISKQTSIIVTDGYRVTAALVETKYCWAVTLNEVLSGRSTIHERADWPSEWLWTTFPKVE